MTVSVMRRRGVQRSKCWAERSSVGRQYLKGVGATVRAVGSGATLEPTVVPLVPVVVEEQVTEEALVFVGTPALLQDMHAHLSFKLGVTTGSTELVSTVCKLAEHASFAVTRSVEVGAGFGLTLDIVADKPV